jgi:hypothetical protein
LEYTPTDANQAISNQLIFLVFPFLMAFGTAFLMAFLTEHFGEK